MHIDLLSKNNISDEIKSRLFSFFFLLLLLCTTYRYPKAMIEKESENSDILTLGQASCLVLGLPPSMENRKLSKEIIEETKIVEVSYKRRGDPFEPFLIGKKVKCVNPFLYKSYDVTPPPSPKFSSGMAKSSKNVSCFLILLVVDDHISIASTGSSQEEAVNLISQEEEHKETSDLSVLSQKTKGTGQFILQLEEITKAYSASLYIRSSR
ncbi:MAG: hypothetical protein JSY10_17910 [Paenibacillus sp.]|nr:hypothetical protein [Paenibacillus sp.]